jgi:hypothetical protein
MPRNTKPTLDMDMPISEENKEEMRRIRDEKARKEEEDKAPTTRTEMGKGFKKGGKVKSSASKRADGCAQRGKTKGRIY